MLPQFYVLSTHLPGASVFHLQLPRHFNSSSYICTNIISYSHDNTARYNSTTNIVSHVLDPQSFSIQSCDHSQADPEKMPYYSSEPASPVAAAAAPGGSGGDDESPPRRRPGRNDNKRRAVSNSAQDLPGSGRLHFTPQGEEDAHRPQAAQPARPARVCNIHT